MPRSTLRKPRASSKNPKPDISDGLKFLAGLVPQITSLVVLLPAVTYFVGWRELSAYYSTLGAPWVLGVLPTSAFLLRGAPAVVLFAICAFVALNHAANSENSLKSLNRIAIFAMGIGALLSLIGLVEVRWISKQAELFASQMQSFFFTIGAGICVAEATVLLSKSRSKPKWSTGAPLALYSAIFFGAYIAPMNTGNAKAQLHLLPDSNTLPAAIIKVDGRFEQWRLVESFGSVVILISPIDANRLSHTFRILEQKEVSWVVSTQRQ